ncbi:hypothetical protein [Bradyrhizobium sp. AZCC 1708]|uniref:hypothetical protein n=1 Tax=Bradyrhizobium sp. AZCC 1708 TaxID=3117015 RepID=UPI002FF0141A
MNKIEFRILKGKIIDPDSITIRIQREVERTIKTDCPRLRKSISFTGHVDLYGIVVVLDRSGNYQTHPIDCVIHFTGEDGKIALDDDACRTIEEMHPHLTGSCFMTCEALHPLDDDDNEPEARENELERPLS